MGPIRNAAPRTRSLAERLLDPVERWLAADALPAVNFKKKMKRQQGACAVLRRLATGRAPLALRLIGEGATVAAAEAVAGHVYALTDAERSVLARRGAANALRPLLRSLVEASAAPVVPDDPADAWRDRKDLS